MTWLTPSTGRCKGGTFTRGMCLVNILHSLHLLLCELALALVSVLGSLLAFQKGFPVLV